jgi:hypothetical protein
MKKIIIGLALMGLIGCAQNNTMELEGRLSVKGSSVHTYLNIKDIKSNKSYKIQNQESFDLMQKQNQTVKVKVKLIKKAT